MYSAFGVEHGEISKSYNKLRPKLANARMYDEKTLNHRTLDEKLRRHAMEHRQSSGAAGAGYLRRQSPEGRAKMMNDPFRNKYSKSGTRLNVLRQQKVGAQGMYDAIGRMNRAKRVLP